jgi:hypothetical protein
MAALNAKESETKLDTILPTKTEAIVALMIAIDIYQGDSGPGSWVIDSGRKFIALTWIFEENHIPLETKSERLWRSYGGEEILTNAGLEFEHVVIKLSGPNRFMSAIIPVRD